MTLDLDADLAYVDGAGPVTIRLHRPNGTREYDASFAVMGDLSRALRSFGGIELSGGETAWELPDVLGGEKLSPDDEIVAADATYVVVQSVKLPLDAGWRAIAVPRRGGVV